MNSAARRPPSDPEPSSGLNVPDVQAPLNGQRSLSDWTERIVLRDTVGVAKPPLWLIESYAVFRRNVMHADYPCFFGRTAEKSGDMYYAYAERESLQDLPATLSHFLTVRTAVAGRRTNLAVFFKPELRPLEHHEYGRGVWDVLQYLYDHDPHPERNVEPYDPSHHLWMFPFSGTLFFIVAASPSHRLRRSRNLGPGVIMIFQPSDVFIDPQTRQPISAELRETVRQRLRKWDAIAPHPDLGIYPQAENLEWVQFFLSDDSRRETGTCPFHAHRKGP